MTDAPILTTGLRKAYGRTVVLDGCDLAVPRGSVTGLLGRNGAGKSTLLRCLIGLAKPDAGHARLLGEDGWDLRAATKTRIGWVPQQPTHLPGFQVSELLAYLGSCQPTWDSAFAERLRADWEIPPRATASALSPGEAQRLALVMALAHRPEVLVFDEPAAALDPVGRRQFLSAVMAGAAEGATVLLSTHLCADLERIADRVAVLARGRIVLQTGIDAIKEDLRRITVPGVAPERLPAAPWAGAPRTAAAWWWATPAPCRCCGPPG
jgi:ABC-2 type transport system ATP-binding protein